MSCSGMAFFSSNFMLQPHNEEEDQHPSSVNPILPSCTTQNFHGLPSMLGRRSLSFSGIERCEEMNCEDDLSDDGSQAGEKKRRLNIEQVKTLEKNFEIGNKLEPERKMQLARALGLQPRQIAIWFQNRRARWKTKQLEKDYDLLKRQFEAVKADNDVLQTQNKKLQEEIMSLKSRDTPESINLNKETEGSCSNRSENSSDVNLDISKTSAIDSPLSSHTNRSLFPSMRPTNMAHFHHTSSRADHQCPKMEHIPATNDETFCSMFISNDDQPGFWPWSSENNHFH